MKKLRGNIVRICINSLKMLIHYLWVNNKQLLDEVFVICGIISVIRIISRAEDEADNSYRDVDNFAYHKNRIR